MKRINNTVLLLVTVWLGGCSATTQSVTPQNTPQSRIVQHDTKKTQSTPSYEVPTSLKEKRFHSVMIEIAQSTHLDPNYHRLGLKSDEEKRWFKNLMYRLWDRQITRQQFISEGTARFPNHRYEFTYIANAFQSY